MVALVATMACLAGQAGAQDYPNKTVRVIIPLGAGGGGDIFTRALSDELQKRLGQTFIVENRTGGGLNIGTRACGEAAPDGYTICVLSSEPIVYSQYLFKSLPFNPEKDFEPITNLFFNTLAFAVNNSLKVKTVPELMALAKQQPGKLSYSTFSFPLVHYMDGLHRNMGSIRARALSQRQRGDDRAVVGRDADHAARPVQHGSDLAGRQGDGAGGQFEFALAAVP
jgi:tripartite-type tricarboxylate transporter receptor subunit TctC